MLTAIKNEDTITIYDDTIQTSVFDGTEMKQVPTIIFTGTVKMAQMMLDGANTRVAQANETLTKSQAIFNAVNTAQ